MTKIEWTERIPYQATKYNYRMPALASREDGLLNLAFHPRVRVSDKGSILFSLLLTSRPYV